MFRATGCGTFIGSFTRDRNGRDGSTPKNHQASAASTSFATRKHALKVWAQASRPIDLLVNDMVMPGGIRDSELAEQLSNQSPRLNAIIPAATVPGWRARMRRCWPGAISCPSPTRLANWRNSSGNVLMCHRS